METLFVLNQSLIREISKTVNAYREQRYFFASKGMLKLNELLVEMSQCLSVADEYVDQMNVLFVLMQAMVEAQENNDYVYLADILEGDLLPFLQELQLKIQEHLEDIARFREKNLVKIKLSDKELYEQISSIEIKSSDEFQISLSISGHPILNVECNGQYIHMHSTIDPWVESNKVTKSICEKSYSHYYVWGMGMGYHVLAILKNDPLCQVTVLESHPEILIAALTYTDFSEYLGERLFISFNTDEKQLLQCAGLQEKDVFLFIHYPSLQIMKESEIKELLEDYFINISSMKEQGPLLRKNFHKLKSENLPECGQLLKELFYHKTIAIIAGGPSVDYEIEAVKRYRKDIVIFAVGRIVKKLVANGIMPDVMIITDPQSEFAGQFLGGVDVGGIPLLLLSTAPAESITYHPRNNYVVYQKDYEYAEKTALDNGYQLCETGGSVSTTAVDLALRYHASRLILIGLDLAYTNGKSHASGAGDDDNMQKDSMRQVKGITNEMLYTTRNLDIYRKWIEKRIVGEKGIPIYNTGQGARINGTIEMTLEEIMSQLI